MPDERPRAAEARAALFGADLKAMDEPQPMSRLINWALTT
jgi:2-oxoisovalerate dehydrogenase E1 component